MYTAPWPLRMIARVPLWAMAQISGVLSLLWWYVLPIRVGQARQNLQRVFPELAPGPVLRKMMQELILGYLEILCYDRLELEVTGAEALCERPGIVLAGHLGSWDIGVLASGDAVPMALFLKRPKNPHVFAWLEAQRLAHRVTCLWDGSTLDDGLVMLDAGKNLFFVQDQRLNRGIELPFFGQPARTSVGFAAAIQRRPLCPVWTVSVWREGVGRHRIHFAPFFLPERSEDPQEDRRLLSLAANRWYEEQIRARPWAWLWLHRRWK